MHKLISLDFNALFALRSSWEGMLSNSESREKIYQSLEFMTFLHETAEEGDVFGCVGFFDNENTSPDTLVALVPYRFRSLDIDISVGKHTLFQKNFLLISILGSSILKRKNSDITIKQISKALSENFQKINGISFQSISYGSSLSAESNHTLKLDKHITTIIHGWRQCHSSQLPSTFEAYEEQFSRKKRYNLRRQLRQLESNVGGFELTPINTISSVPLLSDAIRSLGNEKNFLSSQKYEKLADNGLLLSYILRSQSGEYIAAIVASRYEGTLHIHNILTRPCDFEYSPGTSLLHLVVEDLIERERICHIDFGFGTPNASLRSCNRTELRGHLLIVKKTIGTRIFFWAHSVIDWLSKKTKLLLKKALT